VGVKLYECEIVFLNLNHCLQQQPPLSPPSPPQPSLESSLNVGFGVVTPNCIFMGIFLCPFLVAFNIVVSFSCFVTHGGFTHDFVVLVKELNLVVYGCRYVLL